MKLAEGWMTRSDEKRSADELWAAGHIYNALLKYAQANNTDGVLKVYRWAIENGDYFYYDFALKLLDEMLALDKGQKRSFYATAGIDPEKDLETLKQNSSRLGKSYYLS